MQCSRRSFECLRWLIVSPHLIPALLALCFEVQDFPRMQFNSDVGRRFCKGAHQIFGYVREVPAPGRAHAMCTGS